MAKKRSTKKSGSSARKKSPARKRALAGATRARSAPRKRRAPTAAARHAARRPARRAAAANPMRELAQRIVSLTVSHQDEQALAFYADSVESIEPGAPPAKGIEAIRQKFTMWHGMVSDATWQARNVWVDSNTIAIEWTGRVTFAATGKQADFNEVAIHEIEGGKIVRERFYYDRAVLQP